MTPEQIKSEYEKVGQAYSRADDRLADAQAEMEVLSDEMQSLEAKWLKTHPCSCELIGIRCVHNKE